MHNRTFWVDQVEDQDGQVIQQGTLIDQAHLNNMEVGISDIHLAYRIIQNVVLWFGRRLGVLETSSNSHDTDIASIKSTDTTQNSRLSAGGVGDRRGGQGSNPDCEQQSVAVLHQGNGGGLDDHPKEHQL